MKDIWIDWGICPYCGHEGLLLYADSSGYEYDPVTVCRECVLSLFERKKGA